jgi:hypothetical protein
VEAIGTEGDWLKVKYENKPSAYVQRVVESGIVAMVQRCQPFSAFPRCYMVNENACVTDCVDLRREPTVDAEVVGVLQAGKQVIALDRKGPWLKVIR